MKLESDLSKVEPTDWVLTLQYGWCRVRAVHVCEGKPYKIEVYTEYDTKYYQLDGKHSEDALYPTCFPSGQVPKQYLEIFGPPPMEFEAGDKVLVSFDGQDWYPRIFAKYENGKYHVFSTIEKTMGFPYCREWEDLLEDGKDQKDVSKREIYEWWEKNRKKRR